ncbi:dimethylarginine dimethylaminohydrolase family protein [Roseovarius pelagicus]|uniref:arginine deiminase n=1 Tax=Roseovarius pelagicus TaxID=2980108 RepID=A0ABY6D844_9RHOB|nr:arginine deiminase family protein [Roseovarius pelagicus]UXX82311.1 arginine deiminase family protein [Roseovarius pelagicus]
MAKDATHPTDTLRARKPDGDSVPLTEWGIDSEYGVLHDVLLGPVETFGHMDNVEFSSIYRETAEKKRPWDHQSAVRQHREMCDAYEAAGVRIHTLPADEHLKYGVYARDSSFMTPWGAVITQMANPRRRGEYAAALRFYLEAGIPIYDMVTAGNFEGGDFHIIEPGAVLIGYTGKRCEEVSARQIGRWMELEGWEVKYASIDPFYVHIDLMVCMIAEKCAAVCVETTPDDVLDWLKSRKVEIVPVGFKDTMALGCNVMSLGNERVLSPAASKDLNAKLRANGFTVYDPDMSMFSMMGGGIHCMAQSLRRSAG